MRKIMPGIVIGAVTMFVLESAAVVIIGYFYWPRTSNGTFIQPTRNVVASDVLTTDLAQTALDQAPLGGGTAKALAVNAVPVFGETQVDIQLSNVPFANEFGAPPSPYTGIGHAHFQRNTDGSWTLKTIGFDFPGGFLTVASTNITVR